MTHDIASGADSTPVGGESAPAVSEPSAPQQDEASEETAPESRVSRRGFLRGAVWGGVGGAVLGATAGAVGWGVATEPEDSADTIHLDTAHPFYDEEHQGGIQTTPQQYSMFTALRLASGVSRQELQVLLARWSAAIAVLQRGDSVGAVEPSSEVLPPKDTGEASGLSPASLTVTLGLGPGIFDERFGLSSFKPASFGPLPVLNGDTLEAALTGGDLSLQACADDPQVCYHAIRNLLRIGRGSVVPAWTVLGFGRASAGPGQSTPRNLMGFKDGTRNVSTTEQYEKYVWLDGEEQPWLKGGTYQVVRKIRMLIETWDTDRIGDQQLIFGRTKAEGAPLSGTKEFDTPDFSATAADGSRAIDENAHIALAAPEHNDGTMILRRPYNYTEGLDDVNTLDAGLLFVSYMNDPQAFVTLQNRLGASDLLNEYIRHVGSGIFVVPPAPKEGHYIGQEMFS